MLELNNCTFFASLIFASMFFQRTASGGYAYKKLVCTSYRLIVRTRALYQASVGVPPVNYPPETAFDSSGELFYFVIELYCLLIYFRNLIS